MSYKFNVFTGTFDIVSTVASSPGAGVDNLLLTDGTSHLLLVDGTSVLLLV